MIAYLEGTLLETAEHSCVVLLQGGAGYEVFLPGPLLARLPKQGEKVRFYIHHVVREDAQQLYGFASWDERITFGVLLSLTKVGPKIALAILSLFSPDELRSMVANEDFQALKQVPGIGGKTAQRIFLELKYKLKGDVLATTAPLDAGAANVFRDALAGLTNLGYGDDEARAALEKVFAAEPDLDVASALRQALKAMARDRAQ